MNKFIKIAIAEARAGMRKNHGGPFGAVVVRNGKVISKGHNEVLKTNNPTRHAEMVALQKACAKLRRFDLSDCEMYVTCEPCPMCFSAIHWAKMKKIYFGCTRADAAAVGFDDEFIYDVIRGRAKKKQVAIVRLGRKECLIPMREFTQKPDKTMY